MSSLTRRDFEFALPPDLIAQQPLAERSASRLLQLEGATGSLCDRAMRDLPELLAPGDLLIFNDTRVVPARFELRKPTGGRIEALFERPLAGRQALVQLRGAKSLPAGTALASAGGPVHIVARHDDLWELEFPAPPFEFLAAHGSVPLPPYIERAPDPADQERYQSLMARVPGAVAAPTASLHFDAPLLAKLAAQGVGTTTVTLHVGAGTFQPLRVENLAEHHMHPEWYQVSEAAAQAVRETRARGKRVVAIGTTVARTLEAAAAAAGTAAGVAAGTSPGELCAASGDTTLFIHPGYRFRIVDALLTNFHLPQSTLLMLVSAFAGREAVLAAYAHAVRERYRFFSYGDAMYLTPAPGVRA